MARALLRAYNSTYQIVARSLQLREQKLAQPFSGRVSK